MRESLPEMTSKSRETLLAPNPLGAARGSVRLCRIWSEANFSNNRDKKYLLDHHHCLDLFSGNCQSALEPTTKNSRRVENSLGKAKTTARLNGERRRWRTRGQKLRDFWSARACGSAPTGSVGEQLIVEPQFPRALSGSCSEAFTRWQREPLAGNVAKDWRLCSGKQHSLFEQNRQCQKNRSKHPVQESRSLIEVLIRT